MQTVNDTFEIHTSVLPAIICEPCDKDTPTAQPGP